MTFPSPVCSRDVGSRWRQTVPAIADDHPHYLVVEKPNCSPKEFIAASNLGTGSPLVNERQLPEVDFSLYDARYRR